jgi:hypothetical protein
MSIRPLLLLMKAVCFMILCSTFLPLEISRSAAAAKLAEASSVIATWHGESICLGNRPACRNEEVVYRF